MYEAASSRDRALDAIADDIGIPRSVLNDAEQPLDVARLVAKYYREQGDRGVERSVAGRQAQYNPANRVDTGAGASPPGVREKLQKQYDDARAAYDSGKMLDVMFEADRQGVILREH